jgi:hypothetical protein
MSRNPNYTGNQTFTIPTTPFGLFAPGMVQMPRNGTNPRQNVANQNASLPDYIRPKTESWTNNYLPVYNPPRKVEFNLDTEAKRRSADPENLLR